MWSAKGRIGRVRYLVRCGLAGVAYLLVVGLVGIVLGSDVDAPSIRDGAIFAALGLPVLVFVLLQSTQRARDLGWSAWTGVSVIVPCIGSLVSLVLLCAPGSPIRNENGPPPTPNGRALVITAWVLGAAWVAITIASVLES